MFSHAENSTVSVPVWMVKTGLAAGQTSTFAPQLKVKTNKTLRFVFYRSREKKKAQLFCASWFEQAASLEFVARLYLLCWVKHMSAGLLVTCFAAHVCAQICSFFLLLLSGLFLFADGMRFTCNCAQVQQKSLCSPMFFARLPDIVLPVCSVTFGLLFQQAPCHVLTASAFVLSQQEGAD